MSAKVSILVPIYNVSQFIERCAVSLFEQTFQDIEYIFVNDCTPDDSIDVLNKVIARYPNRQSQIKIINHTENKGIAFVRNNGIQNAKGIFIISVDGDDYIDENMVELMYSKALQANADIVVCDFLLEWENVTKHAIQNIGNSKEDFLKLVLSFNTSVGLCNKMFKREIYIDHNIKAIDGCNMGEDFMICSQLVYYSNKIAKIDSPLYHYIQTNNTSYTKNITKKSIKSVVEILNHLTLFFEEKTDYNSYREFLLKGKLRKKIEFFMFSNSNDWKFISSVFRETDEVDDLSFLSFNEKNVNFFIEKKFYFLLKIYKNIYYKLFNLIQKLKGR